MYGTASSSSNFLCLLPESRKANACIRQQTVRVRPAQQRSDPRTPADKYGREKSKT
jgi:hypothetical protein